ncbi:hypothetical protein E8M12_06045 [Thalassotalea mangrovi]|uniref:Uncharacterized protein n=1 Tax=Thalassotalea mangrovi TaxID=2572245 RepID=A0A4U1B6L2_9GAMM|nr:hypothetical protein E8M12_06045 [Thalassotalea mangrovi]
MLSFTCWYFAIDLWLSTVFIAGVALTLILIRIFSVDNRVNLPLFTQPFSCTASGELSTRGGYCWQLSGNSLVAPWGCYLDLKPKSKLQVNGSAHKLWIYKNMLSDNDYRCLCRIIHSAQRGSGKETY